VLLGALALLGTTIVPANAEGIIWNRDACQSWKDDDTATAQIHVAAKFDAWDYGEAGEYYVKWTQKFQIPTASGWSTRLQMTGTGGKLMVTKAGTVFVQQIKWKMSPGTSDYADSWRVWTRATLYKSQVGPDIRYLRDRLEHSFYKPKFPAHGDFCGSDDSRLPNHRGTVI
jgi:hypothetical protein